MVSAARPASTAGPSTMRRPMTAATPRENARTRPCDSVARFTPSTKKPIGSRTIAT
jgi:hypothetical protein